MTITENIENIPDPLIQTAETGPEMSDTVDEVSGHSTDFLLTDTEVDLIKKDLLHRQVHQEMLELREHLSIAPLFFDKSILQPPPKPVDTGFFNITALFRSNPPTPEPSATTPNSSNTSLHTDINIETPLLQYAFNNFVLNFPFLEKADQSIWHKIQEFLNSFSRLRFGAYAVSEEELSKRERIAIRVENLLTILFNTGITTHGKIEEKKSTNQQDVKMQPRKPHRIKDSQSNVVHVQILTVRKNVEQGYLREKEYSEFVIKSHFIESDETFHVRQRYSQIKKFYEKLGREFPDQDLSGPPRRFKTQPDAALYCEKDRLALQAYLRKLLRNQAVASSQLTRDFLTSTPTDLTPEDIQNADVRAKSVQARAEEHSKFLKVAEQQAEELREITDSFVQDISEPGGLNKLAKALEEVSEIEKLPISYQKMIELARINLASTFYRIFCAEESAVIHFQQLRQAHSMLPYRALKGILMISNPTAMMKAVLDLFLAQPFGHPSILQRVVSSNLHDSLKKKKKVIEGLRVEIKDEPLCDRIHNYVYSSESQPYDGETGMSDLDKLFRVVRDNTIKPIDVNPLVLMKLWSAKEHLETSNRSKELLETTGSLEGFSDSEIMLKNLHKFMFLSTQVRNTELTMDLIFEGITGELLKDILSIFYQPLAQIYKDANISDFVIDCRDFIDKLIQVIEANDIDQGITPLDSLKSFTDLVKEYEVVFYRFVHLLYANSHDGLFQKLIAWFESMMSCLREGVLKEPLDMEKILHQEEFKNNPEFQEGFIEDLDKLKEFTFRENLRHFRRLRKKMISNLGIELEGEEMESILASVPLDIVQRLMKISGLKELPEDLRHLLEVDGNGDGDGENFNHLEFQPNIRMNGFSGVDISLGDLMEVQLSDEEDSNEPTSMNQEMKKNINYKNRHAQVTEPSVPYPKLNSIPKLLTPFMNEIFTLLKS